ncbi:MAG: hypothetical protein WD534_15280 [Phycisphaeraceae bacterium]
MFRIGRPFEDLGYRDLLDTLLPDFALGFTFFTALSYAVLSRRFEHQRSAAAMSVALGLALALGQIWWQYEREISLRQLGPVAVGMAVLMLAAVIYQAFSGLGGAWAGAGIALGASLLIGTLVGLDLPVAGDVLAVFVTMALAAGGVAFLLHRYQHDRSRAAPVAGRVATADVESDVKELDHLRRQSRELHDELDRLRARSRQLDDRPDLEQQVKTHLVRTLPVQGWLTERLAALRERAHLAREGQIHRITQLSRTVRDLPKAQRKAAIRELKSRYRQMRLDERIERLDASVAEAERRIVQLTQRAQQCLAEHDHQQLSTVLAACTKLQKQVTKLVTLIERAEEKLLREAKAATRQDGGR